MATDKTEDRLQGPFANTLNPTKKMTIIKKTLYRIVQMDTGKP